MFFNFGKKLFYNISYPFDTFMIYLHVLSVMIYIIFNVYIEYILYEKF